MTNLQLHFYHLVSPSLWPFNTSLSLLDTTFSRLSSYLDISYSLLHCFIYNVLFSTFFMIIFILLSTLFIFIRSGFVEASQDKVSDFTWWVLKGLIAIAAGEIIRRTMDSLILVVKIDIYNPDYLHNIVANLPQSLVCKYWIIVFTDHNDMVLYKYCFWWNNSDLLNILNNLNIKILESLSITSIDFGHSFQWEMEHTGSHTHEVYYRLLRMLFQLRYMEHIYMCFNPDYTSFARYSGEAFMTSM